MHCMYHNVFVCCVDGVLDGDFVGSETTLWRYVLVVRATLHYKKFGMQLASCIALLWRLEVTARLRR